MTNDHPVQFDLGRKYLGLHLKMRRFPAISFASETSIT